RREPPHARMPVRAAVDHDAAAAVRDLERRVHAVRARARLDLASRAKESQDHGGATSWFPAARGGRVWPAAAWRPLPDPAARPCPARDAQETGGRPRGLWRCARSRRWPVVPPGAVGHRNRADRGRPGCGVYLAAAGIREEAFRMKIFGQHDEQTLAQIRDVAQRAERVALMADGHVGYVMPIGGVAAYRDRVSVVGVGFDIACGNAAIRTDLTLADLGATEQQVSRRLNALADEIQEQVSFGIGRKNTSDDAPVDHPLFDDPAWDAVPRKHRSNLREKARSQLGTVGSGNHYVDVFADESGALWVGVHFGSRGFGHTIASAFLALGQGRGWGERVPEREVLLALDAPLGHDYWHLMELAGRYAYAGREWVARKVVEILGGRELELVHNHHNFAWREMHDGREYIVVRKGATPAFPGQKGFIGGSRGENAVIIPGTPAERADDAMLAEQRAELFSTVHGAG